MPLQAKHSGEVKPITANNLENQPFKNREQVLAEIRRCSWASSIFAVASFLFAIIGIIADALNTNLILQPTVWLLLAVFTSMHAVVPSMHVVVARHLLGIEKEDTKK